MACKNVSAVSSARGFLSMKWFTKGEIFTSCFNFDLNRGTSNILLALSKNVQVPPLVNDNEKGVGAEKN